MTDNIQVTGNSDYQTFLESKIDLAPEQMSGARDVRLDPSLFPHQADAVRWALRHRRALIAMSFGLGKTRIQVSAAKALHEQTGDPFLIVCPLGVKHQFAEEDGPALGTEWRYVRTDAELQTARAETPFLITNYERVRDGNIDPRRHALCGVSLDEGSVIRSLGSKTYHTFQEVFAGVPNRFVCTATPSPNNYRELIYYAEFLGVMDKGQALTRWFKRNPDKAGDLTLMPQHEEAFWLWVASWALFLNKPSDVGYSDEGYSLPDLRVHYHRVATDHSRAWEQVERDGQRRLLVDPASGVSAAVREKRATLDARVERAREIIARFPEKHWLVWHHLEDERRRIEKVIPEAVTVYGSQELEKRERAILDFSRGKIRVLATKPEIAGSGCNFQRHCHSNIFVGVDFSFQDFIQAIHRTQRFQQQHAVDVHIIHSEAEDRVVDVLKRKWAQHNELVRRMGGIMQRYGLSHAALGGDLKRRIGVERVEVKGERFTAVHNDCVAEVRRLADSSIGLIHTSIPFGNHYEYSTQYEDFGHNRTDEAFFAQMDFLIPELLRVLKPGRVAAIHVKDRILYGHQTKSGFLEVEEFSDDTVKAFKRHGFLYEGRRTIVTDVVRENNSTYRLGWSEMCKDATKMGCGLPEYLLLFRRPPTGTAQQYADEPVVKSKDEFSRGRWQIDAHSLWRSSGDRPLTPQEFAALEPAQISALYAAEQLGGGYDYERHVAVCEALDAAGRLPKTFMMLPPKVTRSDDTSVWDDVNFMRNLNASQVRAGAANHLCPLAFDIVERVIKLYSNKDDLVLDPFAGLFSVPYLAIKLGRRGYGVELAEEYFRAGLRYCQDVEREVKTPTLFDFLAACEA
jgi:DNA modification methylase